MMVLGHLFNIIIFMAFVGSAFTILTLLAKKVLHLALPLWFGLCGIAFYLVPFILPTLWIVPPEETSWVYGYQVACILWFVGMMTFVAYYTIRNALAYCALKKYRGCDDQRINRIYAECIVACGIKKTPALFYGTLNEPACVVTTLHPVIILSEVIVKQLTDGELTIVLCHEVTHIKRAHHIYQLIFDFVSMIHWFSPFVWIAKNDFAAHCEMDCDRNTLYVMNGKVTGIDYATTMLRLMELSTNRHNQKGNGIEALCFILAKQRMNFILNRPSKYRLIISRVVLVFFIMFTVVFSAYASRTHFYPYPAYGTTIEYSSNFLGK